jgi:hypothetical protein
MDSWNQTELPLVSAHVLGEHVFCPRAAILARESTDDDGEDEPLLGPRLVGFEDMDAHRFAAILNVLWGRVRWSSTLLAPAVVVPYVVARTGWPLVGLCLALPVFYLLARLWDSGCSIVRVVRERTLFEAAEEVTFDPGSPVIREFNWWSLRKAGFDCELPAEPYRNSEQQLAGKPWRVLTKGTMRIPVVRKHRGERALRLKHIVRIIAYCRLIETCEGQSSPFGVLLFGGSYDCVIVPRTAVAVEQFERALNDVREFLRIQDEGQFIPAAPTDNRCRGCHWGEPRPLVRGESEIYLGDTPLAPMPTESPVNKVKYHSSCGDLYRWVPPHADAERLRITEPR